VEELPKRVSVHGAPPQERVREPVPAVLLECDGGWLLLDTGFNTGPGEPLEEALDAAGIAMHDIHAVAVSRLHVDHAGDLKHFAGRVPVHVQRAGLAYGLSGRPEAERNAIFRIDFDDPRIDWRQADSDVEIAPGVTAVLTAGPRHDPHAWPALTARLSGR
jgi:glyoxylase-like metal-dependent hydrolase (beta-lactamase superfamily II)